jgi:hypothetical protein
MSFEESNNCQDSQQTSITGENLPPTSNTETKDNEGDTENNITNGGSEIVPDGL